jgi:hypothetical protein
MRSRKDTRNAFIKIKELTLNFMTSSILAVFPSETQLWKKDGATETPSASEVMPVCERSQLEATTRSVPNKRTIRRCVQTGSEEINL